MKRFLAAAASFAVVLVVAAIAAPLLVETIVVHTRTGPHRFRVQVAADSAAQERGLMYRRHMAADAGMIFPFPQPEMVIFWMKNTYIPLDLIFVRADGTVSSVAVDAVPMSTKAIPSNEPVSAVIELNAGRVRAFGIAPGDRVLAREFGSFGSVPEGPEH